MLYDVDHSNVSLSDWEKFRNDFVIVIIRILFSTVLVDWYKFLFLLALF